MAPPSAVPVLITDTLKKNLMKYSLRDRNGVIKAVVSSLLANKLMNELEGEFRSFRYENKTEEVTEFEFKADYIHQSNQHLSVYIFKTDRLVPKT